MDDMRCVKNADSEENGKLPVGNFAAEGVATPADARKRKLLPYI